MKRGKCTKVISSSIVISIVLCYFSAIAYAKESNDYSKLEIKLPKKVFLKGEKGKIEMYAICKNGVKVNINKEVALKSNKNNIVSIDTKGEIETINPGNAVIEARYKGLSSNCNIEVKDNFVVKQANHDVSISWIRDENSIKINWTKVSGISSYSILRKENQEYKLISEKKSELTFTDKNVEFSKEYTYKIYCYDSNGKEYDLNEFNVSPLIYEKVVAKNEISQSEIKNDNKQTKISITNEEFQEALKAIQQSSNSEKKNPDNSSTIEAKKDACKLGLPFEVFKEEILSKNCIFQFEYVKGNIVESEEKLVLCKIDSNGKANFKEDCIIDNLNKTISFKIEEQGKYVVLDKSMIETENTKETINNKNEDNNKVQSENNNTNKQEDLISKSDNIKVDAEKSSTILELSNKENVEVNNIADNTTKIEVSQNESNIEKTIQTSSTENNTNEVKKEVTNETEKKQVDLTTSTSNQTQEVDKSVQISESKENLTDVKVVSSTQSEDTTKKEESLSNNLKVNESKNSSLEVQKNTIVDEVKKEGQNNATVNSNKEVTLKDNESIELLKTLLKETEILVGDKKKLKTLKVEGNGIWAKEEDRKYILDVFDMISSAKYVFNESGFLKEKNTESTNNSKSQLFEEFINSIINSNTLVILEKDNSTINKTSVDKTNSYNENDKNKLIKIDGSNKQEVVLESKENVPPLSNKDSNSLPVEVVLFEQLSLSLINLSSNKKRNWEILNLFEDYFTKELGYSIDKENALNIARKYLSSIINMNSTEIYTAIVKDTQVYSGPNSNFYALDKISATNCNIVKVLSRENDFYQIEYNSQNSTKIGYVTKDSVYVKGLNSNGICYVYDTVKEIVLAGGSQEVKHNSNIYYSPEMFAGIQDKLSSGTIVTTLTTTENGFTLVEYSNNSQLKRGYVFEKKLDNKKLGVLAKVNAESTIYAGPGTYSGVLEKLNINDIVVVLETENGWYLVEYNSLTGRKRGYIQGQYLNSQSDIANISLKPNYEGSGYSDNFTSLLTVYSGPSNKYTIEDNLVIGNRITVLDNLSNGFTLIEYSTATQIKRGYVITKELSGQKIGTTTIVETKGSVYLGPDSSYLTYDQLIENRIIVAMELDSNWTFIEYNTDKGRKRGYIKSTLLKNNPQLSVVLSKVNYDTVHYGVALKGLSVYSGTSEQFAVLGSIGEGERITVFSESNGYLFIEYNKYEGSVRGYVDSKYIEQKYSYEIPRIETPVNVQKITYGWSTKGIELFAYRISSSEVTDQDKVFVLVSELHGFEDCWNRDGEELVKIANYIVQKSSQNIDKLNGWTLYVVPSANPDGLTYGYTNNGYGRSTSLGHDLNRSFDSAFVQNTSSQRSFNGSEPLLSPESKYLSQFISSVKADVLIDMHGWMETTYGSTELADYFTSIFGFKKSTGFGKGYIIKWGDSVGIKSMLLELPLPKNPQDIESREFNLKVYTGIMNIISSDICDVKTPQNELRFGSVGEDVAMIQAFLGTQVTGVYYGLTQQTVGIWQVNYNSTHDVKIAVNYIVNAETFKAMGFSVDENGNLIHDAVYELYLTKAKENPYGQDLIVKDLSYNINKDSSATFNVIIKNQGLEPTPFWKNIGVVVYVKDQNGIVESIKVKKELVIGSGKEYSFAIDYLNVNPGMYTIWAVVDEDNETYEYIRENNNKSEEKIMIKTNDPII